VKLLKKLWPLLARIQLSLVHIVYDLEGIHERESMKAESMKGIPGGDRLLRLQGRWKSDTSRDM
jgi:hypothetical protein